MKGQDLKHRINGAQETVKITKAMQLVSASKMAKAEKKLGLDITDEQIAELEAHKDDINNEVAVAS